MSFRPRSLLAAVVLAAATASAVPAQAALLDVLAPPPVPPRADEPQRVLSIIDLSEQTMQIYVDGALAHTFKTSTGRGSYATPTGTWEAGWTAAKWRSRKYNNAPMPWSVFFYQGYAVHGTTAISRLGRPASHGCVRLHPDNAETFYRLVRAVGTGNTIVKVVD